MLGRRGFSERPQNLRFDVARQQPFEQLAQIVRQPTSQAQTPLLAQADRVPAGTSTRRLPSTAGPLPLFALAGLISVLSGLGLTIRRRFLARRQ